MPDDIYSCHHSSRMGQFLMSDARIRTYGSRERTNHQPTHFSAKLAFAGLESAGPVITHSLSSVNCPKIESCQ